MQLATIHNEYPRVNTVYFVASDDTKAVYWLSEPGRRHSIDCEANPHGRCQAVKTDHPVCGLQFTGDASRVTAIEEIKREQKI